MQYVIYTNNNVKIALFCTLPWLCVPTKAKNSYALQINVVLDVSLHVFDVKLHNNELKFSLLL